MDIIELIQQEHQQIEKLLSEIETTEDTQNLYEYFNEIYENFNLYTEVEKLTLYAAIGEGGSNTSAIASRQQENEQAKQLLEEIGDFSPTSEEFKAKIQELKQVVQHHIKEENKLFSLVRADMSVERSSQLAKEYMALKDKLQSEVSFVS